MTSSSSTSACRTCPRPSLSGWQEPIERAERAGREVTIALVGKYVQLARRLPVGRRRRCDHAGVAAGLQGARSSGSTQSAWRTLPRRLPAAHAADGILIPGGFGGRGIEGKIAAAQIARERRIPYLGICLGMQIAVAEFARHVAGMEGANSTEFDLETPYPGHRPAARAEGDRRSRRHDAPGRRPDQAPRRHARRARSTTTKRSIYERHRHRYEVNNLLRKRLQSAGLIVSGTSPDERLVEVIELEDHPFFVASQFHPEFKSRPERPAPLFREFVAAALSYSQGGAEDEGRTVVAASEDATAPAARS